jgi:hypothetical protein
MKVRRKNAPIVMISSYPPRLCGIATFCEEAREFIQKRNPDREVLVISHTDGAGVGVFPLIDMSRHDWWKPVAEKVKELEPYAVHIEHEYGLYEFYDDRGKGDENEGFIDLLTALGDWPVVVEPHTIHGRMRDVEADFVYRLCEAAGVVLFKCHYQKWRLDWSFRGEGWKTPLNIMVVPHGARPDKRWGLHEMACARRSASTIYLTSESTSSALLGGSSRISAGTSSPPCGRGSRPKSKNGRAIIGTSLPPVLCGTPTTFMSTRNTRWSLRSWQRKGWPTTTSLSRGGTPITG